MGAVQYRKSWHLNGRERAMLLHLWRHHRLVNLFTEPLLLRQLNLLIHLHLKLPESPITGMSLDQHACAAIGVTFPHLDWHEETDQRLGLIAHVNRRFVAPISYDELGHDDAAALRLDPESAPRGQVLACHRTNQCVWRPLFEFDDPHFGGRRERRRNGVVRCLPAHRGRRVAASSECDSRLVVGQQERQRERGRVDVPFEAADVVAGALVENVLNLL
jgi:hypothetical protein